MCRLVEFPRPLLELEGDVHFYEPPKTPFPDPVFGKLDAQVTGLGIEILDNNVDWLRQNPHDYWIGGVHLHPSNDWRWNAERIQFLIKNGVLCERNFSVLAPACTFKSGIE